MKPLNKNNKPNLIGTILIVTLLLKKDISILVRSKDGFVSLITLILIHSIVLAFATSSALLPAPYIVRLLPAILLSSFIFSTITFIENGCLLDYKDKALEAIIVTGISTATIYVAKVISISILATLGGIFALTTTSILLNVSAVSNLVGIIVCLIMSSFGIASLFVLLSTLTANSKLHGILLPIIGIPLSFPIILPTIEFFLNALLGEPIWNSTWFTLIIISNIVYFVGGINLYDFAVKA